MKLYYSKKFEKRFGSLSVKIQDKFFRRIDLFLKDPNHPDLKSHPLKGNLLGCRAFSVTGDYRVMYRILSKTEIKLLDIGTHNQVY